MMIHIFGLYSVPENPQNHKCDMGVLLLMKVNFGPHPRARAGCQEDQTCDDTVGMFSPTSGPLDGRTDGG